MQVELALFDMDDTLVAADTSVLWCDFLLEKGLVSSAEQQLRHQMAVDYAKGTLDLDAYYSYEIEVLKRLGRLKREQLRQQYFDTVLKKHIVKGAPTLIQQNKNNQITTVLITATVDFLAKPVAQFLKMDYCIATQPEMLDADYTGKLIGGPCMKIGKLKHFKQWLATEKITPTFITFYSDSHNDLPLLEEVDKPIAVDPDPILLDLAKKRAWEIISLRLE